MASSYALPTSAIHHSHSHHGHSHSHSHSPRAHPSSSPRAVKQERSNGSLHNHTQSESHLPHIHEHDDHDHGAVHSHGRSHARNQSHLRESSPYLPSPISQTTIRSPSPDPFFQKYEPAPMAYQPPLSVDVHSHDHHGHDHHHGGTTPLGPRSKVTAFILPFVMRWPLIHTIMADKDSRRIFYFMRYTVLAYMNEKKKD